MILHLLLFPDQKNRSKNESQFHEYLTKKQYVVLIQNSNPVSPVLYLLAPVVEAYTSHVLLFHSYYFRTSPHIEILPSSTLRSILSITPATGSSRPRETLPPEVTVFRPSNCHHALWVVCFPFPWGVAIISLGTEKKGLFVTSGHSKWSILIRSVHPKLMHIYSSNEYLLLLVMCSALLCVMDDAMNNNWTMTVTTLMFLGYPEIWGATCFFAQKS